MSTERLQRIAAMNDRYTAAGKIAGTLTAVVRNGKIVHQSASGIHPRIERHEGDAGTLTSASADGNDDASPV